MLDATSDLDLPALKSAYDRDGYIALTPLFDTAQMEEVNAALDHFIAETVPGLPPERAFYEVKGDSTKLKQAFYLHEYDSFFADMLNEGVLRTLATQLLGEPSVPKNVEYFNKPAGVGAPTPPHQDGYYFHLSPCKALTCWLALEPVDDENGCLHYVRGSHLGEGFRPHGRSEILGFSQGITDFGTETDEANTVALPGPAGTLLMHDARTIHWAGPNTSQTRSRRALGFVYHGESARVDEAARDAYKAKLEAELREKEKI